MTQIRSMRGCLVFVAWNRTLSNLQVQLENLTELMPSEVLVQLQSRAIKGNKPLFIVHPIEGVVTALKPVATELPFPVWGLQCTPDAPLSTIEDLASFYVKVIYM